jgi:hypothetical protein
MNLDIFRKQLIKAYNQAQCNYCIEDVFYICVTYFEYYAAYMKHTHPPIKTDRLIEIIDSMSICGDIDLDAEVYSLLIERYFQTDFKNCDRNICHFFSGKIRELRYYELEKEGAINL